MATKLEKFDSFDNTQELDLDSVRKAEKKQDSFYDPGFYAPKEAKFPDEPDQDEVPEGDFPGTEEPKPWMNKPEKKKKKVKKGVIIGVIVAGAVILLAGAGFVGYKIYSNMKDAEGRLGDNPIPSFVGDPLSDADEWASAYKDVVIESTEVYDEEVQAGDVIFQEAETDTEGNTVLRITVSKGKDPEKVIALPGNLTEMTETEIREWFTENGFINVTYSYTLTEDVPEGRMISISTTETEVARNTPIEIVICGDGPTEVKEVQLQDFSQMTPAQVTTYAAENGLVLDLQYELSDDKQKDQFIRQSPAAGTVLKTGDKFTVIFSSDTKISIPNVTNMTEDQARKAASDRNLNFSVTYAYNDNIVEGNVITQDPIANAVVYNNGELKVVVSRGRPTIEDFTGRTPAELKAAIDALVANGATITMTENGQAWSSNPAGTIASQSKDGVLNSVDTITYVLSKGPQPRWDSQDFRGKSVDELTSFVEQYADNVGINRTLQYSDTQPANEIIEYSPNSSFVDTTTSVNVIVSNGAVSKARTERLIIDKECIGKPLSYLANILAQENRLGANISIGYGGFNDSDILQNYSVSADGHSINITGNENHSL